MFNREKKKFITEWKKMLIEKLEDEILDIRNSTYQSYTESKDEENERIVKEIEKKQKQIAKIVKQYNEYINDYYNPTMYKYKVEDEEKEN